MNLGMTDADFAQLFVDLGALDAFIDQQMHRLAEYRRAAHSAHFVHGVQCRGHVIAGHVKPARSGRIYLWHFFQLVRLTADNQFRHINVAHMIAALRFVHVMCRDEKGHAFTSEREQ